MEDLREEIDALKAILMNDVAIDISSGDIQANLKLQSCTIEVRFQEDSYHSTVPEIQVMECGEHHGYFDAHALERHLIKTAESLLEDSYLYSLYQAGQDWIRDNQAKTLARIHTAPHDEVPPMTPVCKYFLEGRCKFNERCRNLHPGSHTNTGTNTEGIDHTPSRVMNQLTQGMCNVKVDTNSDSKVSTTEDVKKPRMRTATDVISRIQWDSELLESEFFVGYSDRFLGIIEKNFSEFCWEDLSMVGMETLAIPKHRIQYFKYRAEIVWDRRSQVDKFFGSRGEGVTIHDLVRKNETEAIG